MPGFPTEARHLIYACDSLRPDILWSIVVKKLPLLKKEIMQLLDTDK